MKNYLKEAKDEFFIQLDMFWFAFSFFLTPVFALLITLIEDICCEVAWWREKRHWTTKPVEKENLFLNLFKSFTFLIWFGPAMLFGVKPRDYGKVIQVIY